MSLKITVTSNANIVATKLGIMPARIGNAMRGAIRKSAFLIERQSKIKAPVDTGRLRSSIRTTLSGLTASIRPTVDYASFVHDGTRNQKAQPFMTQGVSSAESEIRAVFNRAIKGALR